MEDKKNHGFENTKNCWNKKFLKDSWLFSIPVQVLVVFQWDINQYINHNIEIAAIIFRRR